MKDQSILNTVLVSFKLLNDLNLKELNLDSQKVDLLAASWIGESNMWMYTGKLDPLSVVLLVEQCEPFRRGDDDLAVATLANMFKRNANWVKSFNAGIHHRNNNSTSISGYVLGLQVRKELCTKFQKELDQNSVIL